MATTKIWAVKTRLDHVLQYATDETKTRKGSWKYSNDDLRSLRSVMDYAMDDRKVVQDGECYVTGINCAKETALDSFVLTKKLWGKEDGVQAYHAYMSFGPEDSMTPELAQKIGVQAAKEIWGDRFECLVSTHCNTDHLHCHFVINSVSFKDGKKMRDGEKGWIVLRNRFDDICRRNGLSVIVDPERGRDTLHLGDAATEMLVPDTATERKEPVKYMLSRQAIDAALAESRSLKQMQYRLTAMGYDFNMDPNRKYWTIRPYGYGKPIRIYRLGEAYTEDRLRQRILMARPAQTVYMTETPLGFTRPRPYPQLPRRIDRIKRKRSSLERLYLRYGYMLGIFPTHMRTDSRPFAVHPELRQDLARLKTITEETRLLSREHIETKSELYGYRDRLLGEIGELQGKQYHLYYQRRKEDLPEPVMRGNEEAIRKLNAQLKEKKHELKLIQNIDTRSESIEKKIQIVERDDEDLQRVTAYPTPTRTSERER